MMQGNAEEELMLKFQKRHLCKPQHPSCYCLGTSCSTDALGTQEHTYDTSKHGSGTDKQLEDLSVCRYKKQRVAGAPD